MQAHRPGSQIPIAPLLLAAAVVTETGCTRDEGLGSIGELYLDWIDVLGQQYTFQCDCAVEAGYYETIEECWQPPLPPPLEECVVAVIDGFEGAAENLECEVARQTEFLDCMTAAGCDGDIYACYQASFGPDYEPCPPIPYAAERAIADQCYGVYLPAPFTCDDSTQIPETWQCDGEADCPDGSDEQGCPAFTCGDGSEVPGFQQCDGEPQCPDLSDEQACPGQFTCGDGYGIPLAWQCDGYPDCADESDEQGC